MTASPPLRAAGAALLAAGLVLATAPLAAADNLTVTDGDTLTTLSTLDVGAVCLGAPTQRSVTLVVKRAGSGHVFANGARVTFPDTASGGASLTADSVTLPADWVTFSSRTGNIDNPGDNGDTETADGAVTVDTSVVGAFDATLQVQSSGEMLAGRAPSTGLDVTWTVEDCAPTPSNTAPTVSHQAPDATGDEGDTLATGGSFTDADGDPLTLSADNGTGIFTDNGDGSFTWSLATTDDVAPGSVTVTASDGQASVTQSFAYGATNVAPSVDATVTATAACSASVGATVTDPGSGDTHDFVVDWGDGSSTTSAPVPVVGSHTYTADGTYTATVTVTDDDGGVGSDTAGFTTKLTPSALMQPINAAGSRSTFKLGSTVPVKITVTGCDEAAVTTLAPTVSVTRLDTNADGTVNETSTTATPTNGLQMRFSDGIYIYNLSTRLSQQTGTALAAGTYRVSVDDPSFYAPTSAAFDLRK